MQTMTNEELADAIRANFDFLAKTPPSIHLAGGGIVSSADITNPVYEILSEHHRALLAVQSARAQFCEAKE